MLNYINYFNDISPQMATLIIAALPIAENRVSVPLALGAYNLSVWQALLFSIIGSVLAAAFVVYSLEFIYRRLQGRLGIGDRLLQKIFDRTEKKFMQKYQRWGELALLIFVAVPLPMTGVWTGSVAAFLFGIKPTRALLFISAGVILSACIMVLLSLGIIHFI